jgi:L-aminopeptidase/D-esterase-like protein
LLERGERPRPGAGPGGPSAREEGLASTTIGLVATNAPLTKAQAQKLAQMAHDGLARAISPVHTPADGDTVFALGTGRLAVATDTGRLSMIGALAAEVMADAIVRAARAAVGLPGLPASRDLATEPARR